MGCCYCFDAIVKDMLSLVAAEHIQYWGQDSWLGLGRPGLSCPEGTRVTPENSFLMRNGAVWVGLSQKHCSPMVVKLTLTRSALP